MELDKVQKVINEVFQDLLHMNADDFIEKYISPSDFDPDPDIGVDFNDPDAVLSVEHKGYLFEMTRLGQIEYSGAGVEDGISSGTYPAGAQKIFNKCKERQMDTRDVEQGLTRGTTRDQEALDRIFNNLKAGNVYGQTKDTENHGPFFNVNIHAHTDKGKELFYYSNHGSSAVEATKEQLAWLLGTIFKMSPSEFEKNYMLRAHDQKGPAPKVISYEEFTKYVQEHIKDFLPDDYKEASVNINKDMNTKYGHKDGVLVRRENENVTPVVYLNDFWQPGMTEDKAGQAVDQMAEIRYRSSVPDQSKVVCDLRDFNSVKDRIVPRLVRSKGNEEYLADKIHMRYQDMEIMYTIDVNNLPNIEGEGKGSCPITKSLMESYGIDQETIHSLAMENIQKTTYSIQSMAEMLLPPDVLQASPDLADQPPFILTNTDKIFGASLLLNERALKDVAQKLDGDYIVLPSSVHEVLVLPMISGQTMDDLTAMVQDVNSSVVSPEDVLAEHPFVYDSAVGVLLSPNQYFRYNAFDPDRLTPERFEAFTRHAASRRMLADDKNAVIYEMNGDKVLSCYGDPVAFVKGNDVYRLKDQYSNQVEYDIRFFAEHEAVRRVHDASEIPMYQPKEDPTVKEIRNDIQKAAEKITPTAKAALFDQGNERTR